MKKSFFLFIFIFIISNQPCFAYKDILVFEGNVPKEINKTYLLLKYYQIYKIIAPNKNPNLEPLRIMYYQNNSNQNFVNILPEWGGGGTISPNLIIIPCDKKPFLEQDFNQITCHEIVHAVLYRAYPNLFIPRWFHEGIAMTLSGEISFWENIVISKAIFTNSLMSLSSIDSVNSFGKHRAELAYSQSHLAVIFLIDKYGIEVISEILSFSKKRGFFWSGFKDALYLESEEFENLLRQHLISRYHLIFLFSDYYALWILIALLFIVASVFVFIRKKKKLMQLEKEDNLMDMQQKTESLITQINLNDNISNFNNNENQDEFEDDNLEEDIDEENNNLDEENKN